MFKKPLLSWNHQFKVPHPAPRLNTSLLRSRLKLKSIQSHTILKSHHAPAVALLESAGIRPGGLRAHAARMLTAGFTAGTLILTPPQSLPVRAGLPSSSLTLFSSPSDLQENLSFRLQSVLPPRVRPLNQTEENNITQILHDTFGIHASARLEGNKLNTSYGLIGAEQHLPRYPGDSAANHGQFIGSGITSGRGAWGYFAPSREHMTPDLYEKEKYYVAVQTMYLPDWQIRLAYLRDWFKHRKVLIINAQNGKAIIAVVADAGPAASTGKHFGGSPEVMAYLRRQDGRARGPVILFFVDDPQDKVPLGPLEYNLEKGLPLPPIT